MKERFTNKARQALDLAALEAGEFGHNYVGTEHILLGLLEEGTGVAAKALMAHGVTAERVSDLINQLIAPANPLHMMEPGGYLFVGQTETIDKEYNPFDLIQPSIFRKK